MSRARRTPDPLTGVTYFPGFAGVPGWHLRALRLRSPKKQGIDRKFGAIRKL
jgi:hypothetical protein